MYMTVTGVLAGQCGASTTEDAHPDDVVRSEEPNEFVV